MVEKFEAIALDEDFEEHERLFHYTTNAGLCGILESNCLRATHWQTLNDNREFVHARDMLRLHIQRIISNSLAAKVANKECVFIDGAPSISEMAETEAKIHIEALYKSIFDLVQPFVVSFSFCRSDGGDEEKFAFENGVLQNWAIYGRGNGYALQLNPHILATLLSKEASEYEGDLGLTRKVDYSAGETPPASMKVEFDLVADVMRRVSDDVASHGTKHVDVMEVLQPFLKIVSCSKDPYFRIEQEARLVVFRYAKKDDRLPHHPIHIVCAGNRTVPHIDIFKDGLFDTEGLVERILVGPGADRYRRASALETYIKMRGLNIDVAVSKIPLVLG